MTSLSSIAKLSPSYLSMKGIRWRFIKVIDFWAVKFAGY